jgi:hypothetical protein
LAPDRAAPFFAAPPAPFVAGVEPRVGVRVAAAGEDEAVLAGSRRGVPDAGGLVAAAVDIVCVVISVRCETVPQTRWW